MTLALCTSFCTVPHVGLNKACFRGKLIRSRVQMRFTKMITKNLEKLSCVTCYHILPASVVTETWYGEFVSCFEQVRSTTKTNRGLA